jgi:hypothetical protein
MNNAIYLSNLSMYAVNEPAKLPVKIPIQFPVCTLYTRPVESAEAVTRRVPVELKQMSSTSSTCPRNVSTHLPEPMSHILQVRSIDPVAQNSPVNSN